MKPRGHISTPARFTAAREYLGLNKAAMARVMRLGKNGRDVIRGIEQGSRPFGPYQLVMEALVSGWRPHGVRLPIDKESTDAQ